MVKVIEKRDATWQTTCKDGCHSKLEFSETDVAVFIDWEADATYWIVCPVCGIKVYNGVESQLPSQIRQRIYEKAKV